MSDFSLMNYRLILAAVIYLMSVLSAYLLLDFIEKVILEKDRFFSLKINNRLGGIRDFDGKFDFAKYSFITGGVFSGITVFSMYLVRCTSFHTQHNYTCDIWIILLSLPVLSLIAIISLKIIENNCRKSMNLLTSGLVLGSGLVAVHYIEMYSLYFNNALAIESKPIFTLAIIALIIFPSVFWIASRSRSFKTRFIASLIIGGGISIIHYS